MKPRSSNRKYESNSQAAALRCSAILRRIALLLALSVAWLTLAPALRAALPVPQENATSSTTSGTVRTLTPDELETVLGADGGGGMNMPEYAVL